MVEKKAHEVDNWLKRPDPSVRVVLVHGPDRGLVAERARAFAGSTGLSLDDPFAVVRLDGAEIEKQPGRLTEEAAALPMFSNRKLIWVRGVGQGNSIVGEVAEIAGSGSGDTVVLIEAGELRKGAGVRAAVEKAAGAVALPCYSDDGRGVDGVIDETLAREGLTIEPEARHALKAMLGGDRLATRGELEKLALYCAGAGRVSLPDVEAAIGDVSARSQEDLLDAVTGGDTASTDRIFTTLAAGGANAGVVLSAALRRFQALEVMKAEMAAARRTPQAMVAAARPPIFFARRKAWEAALARWPEGALSAALARLDAAVLETRRRPPSLAGAMARQALLALALEARRLARRG